LNNSPDRLLCCPWILSPSRDITQHNFCILRAIGRGVSNPSLLGGNQQNRLNGTIFS
jgi:hypothetical protein